MYPNPQDVLPLPDVEQYRKRAKDLVKASQLGDDALRSWAASWIEKLFELQTDASSQPARRDVERLTRQIADFARERLTRTDRTLSQAQFVIARAHGFASWRALVRQIEGLSSTASDVSAFELAVDAIVSGDLSALERLLADIPDLVRARSPREHHAALLHYVSANGVENYGQRTPANIVAIARRLLDAGADVNAEADVYGGGATTLGLVVTSAHPRQAGVQNALADLLLERGARMDSGIVRSCLMNGCHEAAAHMAARGASVLFFTQAEPNSYTARLSRPARAPTLKGRASAVAVRGAEHAMLTSSQSRVPSARYVADRAPRAEPDPGGGAGLPGGRRRAV